jgi:hypothetical protein
MQLGTLHCFVCLCMVVALSWIELGVFAGHGLCPLLATSDCHNVGMHVENAVLLWQRSHDSRVHAHTHPGNLRGARRSHFGSAMPVGHKHLLLLAVACQGSGEPSYLW